MANFCQMANDLRALVIYARLALCQGWCAGMKHNTGAAYGAPVSVCCLPTMLFGDNLDVEFGFDLFVDVDLGGVVANGLDGVDSYLFAVDVVVVLLFEGFGNHDVVDAAEELAVLTDFDDELHGLAVEGSLLGLSVLAEGFLLVGALAQVLGMDLLVHGSGDNGHSFGKKIVVGIAVLNVDDFVFVAQVGHILFQYDFHLFFLLMII